MKTLAHQFDHGACAKKMTFKEARLLEKDNDHVYELKYDGVRYWLQIRPQGAGHNYLTSRHVSKQTGVLVEKQDSLPQVRDHVFPDLLHDTVLDGEWISDKAGAVSTDVVHEISEGRGKFVCWDVVFLKGVDIRDHTQAMRRAKLQNIFKYLRVNKQLPTWLKLAEQYQDPQELMQRVLTENLEGGVRKHLMSPYGKNWLKIKAVEHFDCIIWGTEESKTSAEWRKHGVIGAIKIGQWQHAPRFRGCAPDKIENHTQVFPNQVLRGANNEVYQFQNMGTISGITLALRKEISANPHKFIGGVVEIKAQQRLPSGLFRSPRFSRFRPDKNAWECVYTKE